MDLIHDLLSLISVYSILCIIIYYYLLFSLLHTLFRLSFSASTSLTERIGYESKEQLIEHLRILCEGNQ